jgi:hypothetical protein
MTPTKTVTINVTGGIGNANRTVTIAFSSGPNAGQTYTQNITLDASGTGSTTLAVPQGTGTYTVKVYNCSTGNPKFGSNTMSAAAGVTTVAVTMSTNPGVCP